MNRRLATYALGMALTTTMWAQMPHEDQHMELRRMDARLQRSVSTAPEGRLLTTVVTADDAEALAARIAADGQTATLIDRHTLTLRADAAYTALLGRDARVGYMQQSHQMLPVMDRARELSDADRVYTGDGLETPFTGAGVVVGIIDQGFEYRHVAFLDDAGQPRAKMVWNRTGYAEGTDHTPTATVPATGDGVTTTSHGTHVSGIAAGSHLSDNDWRGMAPGADLAMITSEFSSAEVLEDVKYVADYARSNNQPWVVNISFGSNMGPHDGTDPTFIALDNLITAQPGGMVVAAVGNDGLTPMHTTHTFADGGGTVAMLARAATNGVLIDLWCQSTDSLAHLSLRPFIYNDSRTYLSDDIASQIITTEIAPYNGKQHFTVTAPAAAIRAYGSKALFGVEVTATDAVCFHAWTTTQWGEFVEGPDDSYTQPDGHCTVLEPAHGMPHCISVAAYNSRTEYTNLLGQTQTGTYGDALDICTFSNSGPALHDAPQPTVAAPGCWVISALSKYVDGVNASAAHVTGDVRRGLKHYYYGALAGTSMATPMVTGAVALWLEANPRLTHEQLRQIVRQSSVMPDGALTDADGWNASWGYGRLNVYEGLKMALQAGAGQSVSDVTGSAQPVTLLKEQGRWRILFNHDEPWAAISIVDMGGRLVYSQRLSAVDQGQETVVGLGQYPPGVYTVVVRTAASTFCRKLTL